MTSDARPLAGLAIGSAWESARPGQPRPLDSGTFALVALPTTPFWARRYTRFFLDSCKGMSEDTAEMAELLVSELVTNAVRFAGNPTRTLRYSERANASPISLSIRQPARRIPVPLQDHGRPGHTGPLGDLGVRVAMPGQQHDPGPLRQPRGDVPGLGPGAQPAFVPGRDLQRWCGFRRPPLSRGKAPSVKEVT